MWYIIFYLLSIILTWVVYKIAVKQDIMEIDWELIILMFIPVANIIGSIMLTCRILTEGGFGTKIVKFFRLDK